MGFVNSSSGDLADCSGANQVIEFNPSPWVLGENCLLNHQYTTHTQETAIANIFQKGLYSVYAEVGRSGPLQSQPAEDFTLTINGLKGPEVLDRPGDETLRIQYAGDFNFNSGANNILMKTAAQCPPDTTANSAQVNKICLYKIGICGNKILDSDEECDDGNLINEDGCSNECEFEELCPLDEEDYDSVVLIDGSKIYSHSTPANAVSQIISLSLGEGEYSVTLVARDNYTGRDLVTQPNEQYQLSFLKNGVQVGITPSTSDLTDYVAFAQVEEIVTTNLVLSDGADSIQAVHSKYFEVPTVSPNSLIAVCVGIKKNIPEPECGNGVLESDEECDYGLLNGFLCEAGYNEFCEYCTDSCELETIFGESCGDGEINSPSEECDDGNLINEDGCSNECELEEPEKSCGDNVCNNNETCSTCETDCGVCPTESVCGNDIIETGEECDDGDDNGEKCDNSDDDCEYCSNNCKIIEREEDNDNKNFNSIGYNQIGNFCEIDWECTSWTSCSNGKMFRECYDKNKCGLEYNRPIESLTCGLTAPVLAEEKQKNNYLWIILGIITLIILTIILVNMKKN